MKRGGILGRKIGWLIFYMIFLTCGPFVAKATTITPLVMGPATEASGINDHGQIVGYFSPGVYGVPHTIGFLDNNGVVTPVIDPYATQFPDNTLPSGINNKGEIVGSFSNFGPGPNGFLDNHGIFQTITDPLVTVLGGTIANSINDNGQIIGAYSNASGIHGFLYSHGIFTTIDDPKSTPTFQGDTSSTFNNFGVDTNPRGINDKGQIVGTYANASGLHGFLYDHGIFTTIDYPVHGWALGSSGNRFFDTSLSGINNLGQIVGSYQGSSGGHSFIDSHGIFNTLKNPFPSKESLLGLDLAAFGINDRSQIVGVMITPAPFPFGAEGFVTSPVSVVAPEPGTWLLLGTGIVLMRFLAARKRKVLVNKA